MVTGWANALSGWSLRVVQDPLRVVTVGGPRPSQGGHSGWSKAFSGWSLRVVQGPLRVLTGGGPMPSRGGHCGWSKALRVVTGGG